MLSTFVEPGSGKSTARSGLSARTIEVGETVKVIEGIVVGGNDIDGICTATGFGKHNKLSTSQSDLLMGVSEMSLQT